MSDAKKTILILAANPKNTKRLRLDEEVKRIEEGLVKAKSEQYQVVSKLAVTFEDIYQAFLQYEPAIVHFSGHGEGEQGIVLENDDGMATPLNNHTLTELFKLFAGSIEYVVFNACYSSVQAEVVGQYIDAVVGMNNKMNDRAAIEFVVAFYAALGRGKPVDFAHQLGCVAITSLGLTENCEPPVIHQHQRQPVATANLAPELTQLSVYLALVTDDLYPARRQIEEHLRSFGVRVLPEQEEAWQAGLQQADLYVQLLSGVAARDPAPNPAEQAQEAESCQVERLLWRDSQLLLEDVPNVKQRVLLAGSAVMASALESFKRYLTQRLETWVAEKKKAKTAVQQALAQSEASGGNLVFINNAPEDQDFAQTLADLLGAEGHSTFLPISGGELSPRELIEDLEGNLKDCDLIILPYRYASPVWVRQQLRNCVKAQAARGKPHRFIALCYCPSQQEKPSLSMALSNLKHFDCRQIRDEGCLTALLREVG